MDPLELISLARQLVEGRISPDQFAQQAASHWTAPPAAPGQLPTATADLDRRRRCGFPEVIFGPGKSIGQLREIVGLLAQRGEPVLATRIDAEQAAGLSATFSQGKYNAVARTFRVQRSEVEGQVSGVRGRETSHKFSQSEIRNPKSEMPHVAVISGGTSDLPVAEEVRETLHWMGVRATMIHDVGVAGPHRLPARLPEFQDADAIVVVAGMEGALPSVVGGYVACPVFAVPTSVGYGANFGGVSALLSMLNSCASNVAVVNIDAGFKAAYLAGLVATRTHQDWPRMNADQRGAQQDKKLNVD